MNDGFTYASQCSRHLEVVAESARLASFFGFRAATDLPKHRMASSAVFAPILSILASNRSELLGTRTFISREDVREAERKEGGGDDIRNAARGGGGGSKLFFRA